MAPETFSVVIPNWNGGQFLPACLDSLRAQTAPPLEVLVVDSASRDGSVELVRQLYPEVHLVALPTNRGFTGAVNAGIAQAQATWVALLNQDAAADARWLEQMARAASAHSQAGALACKIMLSDRRDHFHSAGDGYRADGIGVNYGVWQQDQGQYDTEREVFGPCGGACALRRSALMQVGCFDEDLFMYYDDVDLAWRLQLAGWRSVYAPGALVYHQLNSGAGTTASYYGGRNTLYVLAKDVPTALLRKHWRAMLTAQWSITRDALRAVRGAAARARLRGQLVGLLTWPRMWAKRRAIQRSRRVSIEYLEGILDASPGQRDL
jgi:GT2 family glycosyltransferase